MDKTKMSIKITDLIRQQAQNNPKGVAVFEGDVQLTYAALWDAVEKCKTLLVEQGVKDGVGVGVIGQNSSSFIIHILAVMHADATVLPISHNLKADELIKLCERTQLHFLWSDPTVSISENLIIDSLDVHNWNLSSVSTRKSENVLVPFVKQAALIRFTSGTTGKSKGVILSHQSIIERTESANEILKLDEKDIVMWVLSMAYHFVVSILLYLRYGCGICIVENFMGDFIYNKTNEIGGTFLYVSPMHIRMLNRLQGKRSMPSLNRIISTSMAISQDLCDTFYEKFNLPITQAFGIIEIGLPVINTRDAKSDPAAIGYALPAYDVAILNSEGGLLTDGEVGQLGIRGPGMFDAYLDPPISRESSLEFGYFLTGDLASRAEDGRITIAGRKKNVINVSGNKAFPEEVEAIINQFPGVKSSRVKGFKHPLLHECVMAEVVCTSEEEPDVEALISFCRKRLSTYKVPQRIIFVDELPMTDSGKIARID